MSHLWHADEFRPLGLIRTSLLVFCVDFLKFGVSTDSNRWLKKAHGLSPLTTPPLIIIIFLGSLFLKIKQAARSEPLNTINKYCYKISRLHRVFRILVFWGDKLLNLSEKLGVLNPEQFGFEKMQ